MARAVSATGARHDTSPNSLGTGREERPNRHCCGPKPGYHFALTRKAASYPCMDHSADAYKPAEIAAMVEVAGVAKARLPGGAVFSLGLILAILWPISGFVLLGLEHSIGNLYFFPQAIVAGADMSAGAALSNLIWVTLGNVLGGAGGVALA